MELRVTASPADSAAARAALLARLLAHEALQSAESTQPTTATDVRCFSGDAAVTVLRRMLATDDAILHLDHPNLARCAAMIVVAEGVQAHVEAIDGISVDRHIREHAPALRERLALFASICDGVAHAHAHGVTHGDLRPGLIRVTRDGIAKVLDIGLAIDDADRSPRYLAPEQFSGDAVTPAVDQYALGLILHELLTGQVPAARLDSHAARIAAAVDAADPPAASSTLAAVTTATIRAADLRGAPDAIIARCLRRQPEARYPSVAALADDVRRCLDGRPVIADDVGHADSWHVVLRRHRAPAIAGGALLIALLGSAVTLGVLWQRERARLADAVVARDDAQAMQSFLATSLTLPDDAGHGADATVGSALDRAAQRIDHDPTLNPSRRIALHAVLAKAYDAIGRSDDAVAQAEAGLAVIATDAHTSTSHGALLASIARIEALRCREAAAERAIDRLAEAARASGDVGLEAESFVDRARVADCHDDFAAQQEQADRALATLGAERRPFAVFSAATEQAARARFSLGDGDGAQRLLRDALAHWPDDVDLLPSRVALRHLLLQVTAARGDLPEAERIARENLDWLIGLYGKGPHPATLTTRSALASILFDRGAFAESLSEHDAALADARALEGSQSEAALLIVANRANALKALGRYDEAETGYRDVIAALARSADSPGVTETRLIHAFNLLELLNERQRYAEAKRHGEATLEEAERVLGAEHIVSLETRDALGVTTLALGDAVAAERLHREALALKQKVLGDDSPYTATARFRHGLALAALGRRDEARFELHTALAARRKTLGPEHPDTKAAEQALSALGP